MRWNCPHCGTHLAIADEKMEANWSFSRCYQCAGYALVRRSGVNIIKVDRAPAGEHVILPESSEQPVMNETATRNLARYAQPIGASQKPVVRPATRRNTVTHMLNPFRGSASQASVQTDSSALFAPANAIDEGQSSPMAHLGHAGHAPTSTASPHRSLVGPDAPSGATADRSKMSYFNGVNGLGGFPEPLPDVSSQKHRIGFLPMAIGITAAFALGSGIYLLTQSGAIFEKARASRSPSRTPGFSQIKTEDVSNEGAIPGNESLEAEQKQNVVAKTEARRSYTDQVQSRAMAPDRDQQLAQPAPTAPHPVQLSSENPPLIVQPKTKNIHLRSGPGMVYPVIGNANDQKRYVVTDWSDRWFKILPQIPNERSSEEVAGWIRTDAVQIVPTDATATN